MGRATAPEKLAAQLPELAHPASMARIVLWSRAEMSGTQQRKTGAVMLNEMLMYGAGAMALVVIGTLVAAFFALEHRARADRLKAGRKAS
jgi:hypothetical protein